MYDERRHLCLSVNVTWWDKLPPELNGVNFEMTLTKSTRIRIGILRGLAKIVNNKIEPEVWNINSRRCWRLSLKWVKINRHHARTASLKLLNMWLNTSALRIKTSLKPTHLRRIQSTWNRSLLSSRAIRCLVELTKTFMGQTCKSFEFFLTECFHE